VNEDWLLTEKGGLNLTKSSKDSDRERTGGRGKKTRERTTAVFSGSATNQGGTG